LDLFCPFYEFHLLQVVPDIVFPSGLWSSYRSSCEWVPFVYFLYNTSFRRSIYVSKPPQSLDFNIIYYVPMFYLLIQFYVCLLLIIMFLNPVYCLNIGGGCDSQPPAFSPQLLTTFLDV